MERKPLTTVRRLTTRIGEFASGALRGFALAHDTRYTAQDFADLAAIGANVVRMPIHLTRSGSVYLPPDLAPVIDALKQCAPLGIRVIVVLCPLPVGPSSEWWANPDLQQSIVEHWVTIARALKAYPALQAYDIINEPVGAPVLPGKGTGIEHKTWWLSIAQVLCNAIRTADTQTPIMVEPSQWGLPDQFWLSNAPKVTGLVASFHWYEPRAYTHQGINGLPMPAPLPLSDLSEKLLEARKFAARYGVPVFVGEFNAVRWAPQHDVWLSRAIELFAAEKWGWCVHVFRGWEGWDVEIPADVPPSKGTASARRADTPSMAVLMSGMV